MPRSTITQDAPKQDPVLIGARDREIAEDQRDDKDVVERQRLLDHEGGQVFGGRGGTKLVPHEAAEADPHGDVERRQFQAFGDADLMVVAVQDTKVQHQQRQDDAHEHQPQPDRLAEEQREKK